MSSQVKEKEWYLDSDGSLVNYPQIYQVSDEDIDAAQKLETFIVHQQQEIQRNFLKLGKALQIFDERKLYLARGVPTFRAWLQGNEFDFSYEHATRLIRIVRDLMPILGDRPPLPVSTMKELLPMLTDGSTAEQLIDAYEEVQGLTTRDAQRRLRELRGIEEAPIPTTFRATVRRGDVYHYVTIHRYGEDGDIYEITDKPLRIKPKDWARWEERFGAFVQYE